MSYYVYEDDPTSHVRVHVGSCTHCNKGKGRVPARLPDNRWHGPFDTLVSAQKFARELKRKDTDACPTCLPDSKPASTW